MKQVRVFVANSSDVNIDIKDANVQSILKTGNRVAFFYEDQIFYATHANQTKWYSFTPEGGGTGPAVPTDQNVLNANLITSNKGDQVEPFTISKAVKSNAAGDQWIEFVVADNAFKHEKLTGGSHVDINLAYAHVHNADAGETVSDMYSDANADKVDFQNVLAMIFRQPLTSVNHNIDSISKTLTSNDLVRRYEENNLVNYAIHTDRMVLVEGDSTIAFENIPAGQYKFPIAKIVHATASNIAAVQQIVASAFKSSSIYYIAKAFVTPAGMNIINEVREGCEDRDVNISVETESGISTIYMNITFGSTYTENVWTCNANVKGLEHTRFPKLLANKFHGVVGTSYDCFNNPVILNEYTAANADKYQERYDSKLMYSKGYPYMITITLQKNDIYEYIPNFDNDSASWDLMINGESVKKYVSISEDHQSIRYDAGYDIPEGLVSFIFIDTYKNREYTAEINKNAESLSYELTSTPLGEYNNCTLTKMISRGQASLNSIDSIAFVAFVADKDQSAMSANYDSVGYDLDSNLHNPSGTLSFGTRTATMIGFPAYSNPEVFDPNGAHVSQYCSCDCLSGDTQSTFCFPYIVIDNVDDRIQYTAINSKIFNALNDAGWTDSTFDNYSEAISIINRFTKNKISITPAELNNTNKDKNQLCTLIAYKLKESWNGELPSRELYCFYTLGTYLDNYHEFNFIFTGYRGNGIINRMWGANRRIYNLLFTMDRNKVKDDTLNIQFDDIITQDSATVYLVNSGTVSRTNEPIKLQYGGHTYALVSMQDVNRRVIAEQSFMFDLTDINDTSHASWQYRNSIVSTCYKIEPIEGEVYDEDDYFLEGYDLNKQSVGKWLMINPILFPDRISYNPTGYTYDNTTHIFTKDGTSSYAVAKAINSRSTLVVDEEFIKSATSTGLPAFAVVDFKKKGLNDLRNNFGDFVKQKLKKYVTEKIDSGTAFTNISGISKYSGNNLYVLSITATLRYEDGTTFDSSLQSFLPKQGTYRTLQYVRFYYNPDDNTDTQNFEIVYMSGSTSSNENDVIYGVYKYDADTDDWVFSFNVASND